ncbi:MAG TPA: hypothetical protein VNV14_00935 [Opitutaceae bacterium]|jgi:hypothetical protein|nr:hypothetical protein [Opitutaceae bacterium]
MKTPFIFCLALAFSLFGSGCVLGRRTVDLPVPTATSLPASKGTVAINSIVDARHFENNPDHPSTPSIDGDINSQSAEQLSTVIGRQRNGFGHAMGDVALPPGETVQTRVKELVAQGFARRGYTVTTSASANYTVDVKINSFWAWTPYGPFIASVDCSFTAKHDGLTQTFTVQGSGATGVMPMGTDSDWREAYTHAFEDFLAHFDQELTKAGL